MEVIAQHVPIDSHIKQHYLDYHFKSHNLIYSATSLTARMMDILALMLTEMKESDWVDDHGGCHTPEYTFDSTRLAHWFGVKPKQLYSILQQPAKSLAQKEIGIETNGRFKYNPILSGIEYDQGTLTISPNPKLKEVYIINAAQNGHAKIDNKIFRSLSNPNAKKVFEFLCRYRYDCEMYFITIKKLQIIFGVLTEKGEVLKPAYLRQSAFIHRVLIPALRQIGENEEAAHKLEVLHDGNNIGYQLMDCEGNSQDKKIRFLVKWKSTLSSEKKVEASRKTMALMEEYNRRNKLGLDTLEVLLELEPLLRKLEYTDKADSAAVKIEKLQTQKLEQQAFDNQPHQPQEVRQLDALIAAGLLDDL